MKTMKMVDEIGEYKNKICKQWKKMDHHFTLKL